MKPAVFGPANSINYMQRYQAFLFTASRRNAGVFLRAVVAVVILCLGLSTAGASTHRKKKSDSDSDSSSSSSSRHSSSHGSSSRHHSSRNSGHSSSHSGSKRGSASSKKKNEAPALVSLKPEHYPAEIAGQIRAYNAELAEVNGLRRKDASMAKARTEVLKIKKESFETYITFMSAFSGREADKIRKAVATNGWYKGMPQIAFVVSQGLPDDIESTPIRDGQRLKLTYKSGTYYFEKGKLRSFDKAR